MLNAYEGNVNKVPIKFLFIADNKHLKVMFIFITVIVLISRHLC